MNYVQNNPRQEQRDHSLDLFSETMAAASGVEVGVEVVSTGAGEYPGFPDSVGCSGLTSAVKNAATGDIYSTNYRSYNEKFGIEPGGFGENVMSDDSGGDSDNGPNITVSAAIVEENNGTGLASISSLLTGRKIHAPVELQAAEEASADLIYESAKTAPAAHDPHPLAASSTGVYSPQHLQTAVALQLPSQVHSARRQESSQRAALGESLRSRSYPGTPPPTSQGKFTTTTTTSDASLASGYNYPSTPLPQPQPQLPIHRSNSANDLSQYYPQTIISPRPQRASTSPNLHSHRPYGGGSDSCSSSSGNYHQVYNSTGNNQQKYQYPSQYLNPQRYNNNNNNNNNNNMTAPMASPSSADGASSISRAASSSPSNNLPTTTHPERPRLTEQEKKNNHIASEQKRRMAIREGFDRLTDIVPGLEGQGRSEAIVLKKSVAHLQDVLSERKQLIERIHALGGHVPADLR